MDKQKVWYVVQTKPSQEERVTFHLGLKGIATYFPKVRIYFYLAQMVKDIVGFEGELRWDTAKPDGTLRKLLDISKIKTLGWKPKVSLNEGIKKTYEWYVTTR